MLSLSLPLANIQGILSRACVRACMVSIFVSILLFCLCRNGRGGAVLGTKFSRLGVGGYVCWRVYSVVYAGCHVV